MAYAGQIVSDNAMTAAHSAEIRQPIASSTPARPFGNSSAASNEDPDQLTLEAIEALKSVSFVIAAAKSDDDAYNHRGYMKKLGRFRSNSVPKDIQDLGKAKVGYLSWVP